MLFSFRRNRDDDREKALHTLECLRITKKTETELSTDITCLCGRIYKDKYMESNCQDQHSFEKTIEWYRKGFEASHTVLYVEQLENMSLILCFSSAGINLLFFLAITTEDLKQNNETHKISKKKQEIFKQLITFFKTSFSFTIKCTLGEKSSFIERFY